MHEKYYLDWDNTSRYSIMKYAYVNGNRVIIVTRVQRLKEHTPYIHVNKFRIKRGKIVRSKRNYEGYTSYVENDHTYIERESVLKMLERMIQARKEA